MAINPKEIERVNNTVIGESILVNGKLTGDEDLTVRGRVYGAVNLTKTLIIEPSGVLKADASVRNAIVSGVVVGNITATESVEITREGRMVGDIKAPRIIIVDGAAFRGRVDMGDAGEKGEARPRPAATTTPTRVVRPLPVPARPAAVTARAPVVRPAAPPQKTGDGKPPAPPPPPKLPANMTGGDKAPAAAAATGGAPVPVGLGKKKVIVKRKK